MVFGFSVNDSIANVFSEVLILILKTTLYFDSGPVCLSRSSDKVCDGAPDCVAGEDERPSICGHRRGRKLSLDNHNLSHENDASREASNEFNLVIFGATATISISMTVLAFFSLTIYKRKLRKGIKSKDFISIELSNNHH